MLANKDDAVANATAGHLSTFGQAAQSGSLNGFAAQQASGFAAQNLQGWLQNFGAARVDLGTDNRFKHHTGAVDLMSRSTLTISMTLTPNMIQA